MGTSGDALRERLEAEPARRDLPEPSTDGARHEAAIEAAGARVLAEDGARVAGASRAARRVARVDDLPHLPLRAVRVGKDA